MTDYGPGPCETCGEDIEAHTITELRRCLAQRDEPERCVVTELLRSDCAHCRKDEESDPYEGVLIERFLTAQYDGQCALMTEHRIQAGTGIGIAITDDNKRLGYVCVYCVDVLLGRYQR